MTYLCWASHYEGASDAYYYNLLIPRLIEDLVLTIGERPATIPPQPAINFPRGSVRAVAKVACSSKDAFHLIFFHTDTGGRGLEGRAIEIPCAYCDAMVDLCDWPRERCIPISPRHETEAWLLADPLAVTETLGYRGTPSTIGLPANAVEAERVTDPKLVLRFAVERVRGTRRIIAAEQLFAAIAQRQRLECLRQSASFRNFESSLIVGLASLGCVRLPQGRR